MGVPFNQSAHKPFTPQLSVEWEPRSRLFWANLRTFLRRWEPPRGILPPPYFRGTLTGFHFPARAVMVSVLFHALVVHVPLPGWPGEVEERVQASPQVHLTWYGPIRNLPPLSPPGPRSKATVPVEPKKIPTRGADAFHPRQTIVSMPKLPNHPRQTLIQPSAPEIAPKVLLPLPNIVQWAEAPQPARPRLKIRAPVLGKARPRVASAPPADLPVPSIPNQEKNVGQLNIASSNVAAPRPRFAVTPMSVPQPGPRQPGGGSSEPAPEIAPNIAGGSGGIQNLIALSATPAPPAPVIEVPSGNLQSRTVISPEGPQPGAPANGSGPAAEGGPTGPPGITISGGNPKESSNVSGLSPAAPGHPLVLTPMPGKPGPRLVPAEPGRTRPAPTLDRIKPGAPPEQLLASKRVYTMHVNLPNLSSVAGSWVLRFAELEVKEADGNGTNGSGDGGNSDDLSAPVPLRKVDPKYPPALVSARIEGEVVLYAIIRKDGTVDSIQLIRSVEPQLDRNAIEALAQWKFRPAERHGEPVELEAIIHIPFRAVASVF